METSQQPRAVRPNWIHASFESNAAHSTKYRPDIDGLRAIAVLAVLFFHAGFAWLRSGFVGVDIFYVISGYLITSLLVDDLERGKFSLVLFYERRMRRIFPALFTVLLFCVAAAAVLLDPQEMIGFGKSLLTATFFVSNFYFWHSAQPAGYFDDSNVKPLLHTWSLSVEEQFYLLFPLTLFLLFRWARNRVGIWLLALTAVSFALNIWMTAQRPVMAFYWFIPRAWELSIGALLALKAVPPLQNRATREIAGLLGIATIVCALRMISPDAPFPGYVALLPCVGAWLLIYAGQAGGSCVKTLLSFRPLVFIGVISYSLYLWHWPIIVFSKHLPFVFSSNVEIAIALLGSTTAAFLSFEYIERPFRGSSSPFSRRQIFALGFAASIVTAAFGTAAYRSGGLPQRYESHTRQLVAENLQRSGDFDGSCSNWKTEVRKLSDIKVCSFDGKIPGKVMFWGDSHAEQLYPAVKQLYSEDMLENRGFLFMIGSGCLPDENLNNGTGRYHCDAFSKFAMIRAEQGDIDTVFLGFSSLLPITDNGACTMANGVCSRWLPRSEVVPRFLTDLAGEIRVLRAHGKKVVVCLPFPIYDKSIPTVEISNAVFGRFGLSITPADRTSPELTQQIQAITVAEGATVFDPRAALCPNGQCEFQREGVSLYKDEGHLAKSQVPILADSLRRTLTASWSN